MSPERRIRRNGLPLSCEPCRKSKVRCDHQGPQCSRCIMRKIVCVYDPTPTTTSRKHHSPNPYPRPVQTPAILLEETINLNNCDTARVRQSPTTHDVQSLGSNCLGSNVQCSDQISSPASSTLTGSETIRKSASLFHKEGTSYGPTRFSAVFSENQQSFASAIEAAVESAASSPLSSLSNEQVNTATEPPLKELAIETLLQFPTLQTCKILLQDIDFVHDVWISPTMIRHCLDQVWALYGEYLGLNRSRESAWAMAKDLHENGRHITSSGNGPSEFDWVNWFSGTALTWEMVGLLFSWAGMAFKHKQEWDPVFRLPEQQEKGRRTSADRMRECSVACLKLWPAEVSDITVCLMKNSVKLQSIIFSDESDQLRAGFATVGSAFVTAGLHRLPNIDRITPLNQYRSALSASMYSADKRDSLFHDLSEEDLYSGIERLSSAASKLSPEGWNTDGKIYTTTWLRADALLSPIREDILLLSLSFDRQFTQAQVEALIARLDEVVKSYPSQLQYHHRSRWAEGLGCGTSASNAFIVARIHLDVLQCHFSLQRLMVLQGCDGQKLFDIAEEIMTVIISIWSNRDHIQKYCYTFDWIVVCFGIPAAGILCVELLKANAVASSSMAPSQFLRSHIKISRSNVVKSLVIFTAFLDWIRPTDNNVQLCWKVRDVLKRIVDTAFDPPKASFLGQEQSSRTTPQIQPVDNVEQFNQQIILNSTDLCQGITPSWMSLDSLDWLANVDWAQGEWPEPNR